MISKMYYESFDSLCSFVSDGKVVMSDDDIKHGKRMNDFVNSLTPAKKKFAKAILEINARFSLLSTSKIKESTDIFNMLVDKIGNEDVEHFYVIGLNQGSKVVCVEEISVGGIDQTTVDIRLIMKLAIMNNATQIAVVHNHPSGSTKPSSDDDSITKKIKMACEIIGIRLVDHVIVGYAGFYSYHDNGKL